MVLKCRLLFPTLSFLPTISRHCGNGVAGPNSGSSVDYTYDIMGLKWSFGVEMRDTGLYGFLLPENQIIPNAAENFEAVKVIARAALERP